MHARDILEEKGHMKKLLMLLIALGMLVFALGCPPKPKPQPPATPPKTPPVNVQPPSTVHPEVPPSTVKPEGGPAAPGGAPGAAPGGKPPAAPPPATPPKPPPGKGGK